MSAHQVCFYINRYVVSVVMTSGRRIMPEDLNVTITAFVGKMHGNNSCRDWSRQPQENNGIATVAHQLALWKTASRQHLSPMGQRTASAVTGFQFSFNFKRWLFLRVKTLGIAKSSFLPQYPTMYTYYTMYNYV